MLGGYRLLAPNRLSILYFKTSCENFGEIFAKYLSTQERRHGTGLKIMFFGTDEFALETLKRLHERDKSSVVQNLEVCCTKMKHLVPAVAKYSAENNINVHIWPPNIQQAQFDLGVVASFGHLIPSNIINKFPLGMINVHGSLLPKLRGAAPIIHALKNGNTETGVTIMKIKPKKFDIGDVLAVERVPIHPHELRPQLTHKMAVVGAELLTRVVENYEEYSAQCVPQTDGEASYAPAVDKSFAFIDFNSQSSEEVYNLWRGVGDLMKLRARWRPTAVTTRFGVCLPPSELRELNLEVSYPEAVPGQAVYVKADRRRRFLCIRCRHGWIAVENIYYGNRKAMQPLDFYNGFMRVQVPSNIGNQSNRELGNQSNRELGNQSNREPGNQSNCGPGNQSNREPGNQPAESRIPAVEGETGLFHSQGDPLTGVQVNRTSDNLLNTNQDFRSTYKITESCPLMFIRDDS